MLEVELANLRQGLWDQKRQKYLVGRLPAEAIQERIDAALRRGEKIVEDHPRPQLPRRTDESVADHLQRVHESQAQWERELDLKTQPEFREAFLLAEALCSERPTIERLRQKARAARGLHDVERAGHFESQALYLEVLAALGKRDPVTARRKLERALLAYPKLLLEPEVLAATRRFAAQDPAAVPMAREVFAEQAALLRVIR
jgi:hypothetical protein